MKTKLCSFPSPPKTQNKLSLAWCLISLCVPLHAQRTSVWTGEASNDNWTDPDNWDTSEDPNGGDTAIIPTPFELILDANRSLSQLQTQGTTGNFVEISGSSSLVVNSSLDWRDTVLSGGGTLISSGQSTISGVATFDNWNVTLTGFATINSNIFTDNNLSINANTDFGTSSILGSGDVTIDGTLTKDVANTSHVGLLSPDVLTINGLISANSGVLNISGKKLNTKIGSTQFATNADGRIRLTADEASYDGITFTNHGEMDITDEILGTEQSIEVKNINHSTGSNHVELGANGKFKMTNAQLNGKWLMRATELVGTDIKLGGDAGGFVWERGQVGTSATAIGQLRSDFLISPASSPLPTIKGTLNCDGYILQTNGVFTVAEAVISPNDIQAGKIIIPQNSIYELEGSSSIARGPTSDPEIVNRIDLTGGTLLHSASSNSQNGSLNLPVKGSGTIRNTGSRLTLNDVNDLENTTLAVDNSSDLDSGIRLSGSSFLNNPTVDFTNGGILEFAESSRGTGLVGTLTGSGDGTAQVSDGTLRILGYEDTGGVIIDFPASDGDPEDSEYAPGPVFQVSRADAFSPYFAIGIIRGLKYPDDEGGIFERPRILINKGNFQWSGGTIATILLNGDPYDSSDPISLVSKMQNHSSDFHILSGPGTTRLQDISFENSAGSTVHHGNGISPYLDLRRATLNNKGIHLIKGDGRITVSGTASESLVYNYPEGIIRKISGTGTSIINPPLDNEGTIESLSGTLSISGTAIEQYDSANKRLTGGTWSARDGGILRFSSIPSIQSLTESAKVIVNGSGSDIRNSSNASLFANGPLTISDDSELRVADDASVEIGTTLSIGGLLTGNGEVDAPVVIVFPDGTISPGLSPGALSIVGNLTFQTGSTYHWEAGPSTNDRIDVAGEVILGGNLKPDFIDGFTPNIGETFTIANAASISGSFDRQDLSLLQTPLRLSLSNTGTELMATLEAAHYSDFDSWRNEQFSDADLLDPLISGPNADPDNDDITNLFEHVSGLSPHSRDQSPISYAWPPGPSDDAPGMVDITFRWLSSVTDEQFDFEFSNDLDDWLPANTEVLSDIETDGVREITVRIAATSNAMGSQYFRMVVRSL